MKDICIKSVRFISKEPLSICPFPNLFSSTLDCPIMRTFPCRQLVTNSGDTYLSLCVVILKYSALFPCYVTVSVERE